MRWSPWPGCCRLPHGQRLPELVNYGCPGETTASFVAGPCPAGAVGFPLHDTFAGPQLDAAVEFLQTHRGRVDVVTLSLWGNDANAFVASCNGNIQCIVDGATATHIRPTRATPYWPTWPKPSADYCATPYRRSPASPRPGTM